MPEQESSLMRLYARRGWRLVPLYVAIWGLGISFLGLVPLVGVPVLAYLEGGAEEFWITFAIAASGLIFGVAAGVWHSWRSWAPAAAWLRDPGSGVSPEDAWAAAVFLPLRYMARVVAAVSFVGAPAVVAYWIVEFDLEPWEALASVLGGATGTLTLGALIVGLAELRLKPLVARIADALPPDWQGHRSRWNVRARAMLAFSIVAAMTGICAGALVNQTDSPGAALAAGVLGTLAVVVLVGTPVMFVAASTLLQPLSQLREGTARVGQGDFSTPIPPTSADELGEVVQSFNRMQHGLQERERLAAENVELVDEIRASRARILTASDAERRRVERNLHDGAQQRLVALALRLRLLRESLHSSPDEARELADAASADLDAALSELRELARGLHPQVLSAGGLRPALEQLAERAPIPIRVDVDGERYPGPVESTAYFVASEALANVAKYSQASRVEVSAERRNGRLVLAITDDGVGGADPRAGSGLTGLADRVAALDGELSVTSPQGGGTTVRVELPLAERDNQG